MFGSGAAKCVSVDANRCRTGALWHNTEPLPVANVLDKIQPWHDDADFYYVDAGPVILGGDMDAAPYFGPGWYWKESYKYMLENCIVFKGRITRDDVICVFRASEHAEPGVVKDVYSKIEEAIDGALKMTLELPYAGQVGKLLTKDDIYQLKKGMLLSMQGAWLTRASPSWSVTNSTCANDAEGPITKTRELEDGTTKFMSRKFLLSNRSMYLIGLISLHKEHLIMAQLRREVKKKLSILPSGACVDCLFYDAKHTASLRAVIALLKHPDGSMIWKLEDKNNAPHCGLENAKPAPTKSIWVDHTDEAHSASIYNFGDWSTEKRFACKRTWRVETEPRGLGLFPGDDYQDMVSEALVQNGGGVVVGQGGSGKSEILKRVKILLEAAGWAVHVVAFTHVAAANCGGHTIMRELHSKSKQSGWRC